MPRFSAPFMMTQKWANSAARRRCHAKSRRKLALMLGWHVDCVATYGEMRQELLAQRRDPARGLGETVNPREATDMERKQTLFDRAQQLFSAVCMNFHRVRLAHKRNEASDSELADARADLDMAQAVYDEAHRVLSDEITATNPIVSLAEIIRQQLGGQRFDAMVGAKDHTPTERGLAFRIPGAFARDGINCIVIEVNPSNLYDVRFARVTVADGVADGALVQVVENVSHRQLREVVADRTGIEIK